MFFPIVATVYKILALNKFYLKKEKLTSVSHYNKPIIVLFFISASRSSISQVSSLLLTTFYSFAQVRSNFFQTVCCYKTHPPKGFSSLQIVAVVHHKPETPKFGQVGSEKWVGGGTFRKIFKNCFEIFHT